MSPPPLLWAGVEEAPNEKDDVGAEPPEAGVPAGAEGLLPNEKLPNGLPDAGAAGADGLEDDPNENPVDAGGAGADVPAEPKAKPPPKGDAAAAGALIGACKISSCARTMA